MANFFDQFDTPPQSVPVAPAQAPTPQAPKQNFFEQFGPATPTPQQPAAQPNFFEQFGPATPAPAAPPPAPSMTDQVAEIQAAQADPGTADMLPTIDVRANPKPPAPATKPAGNYFDQFDPPAPAQPVSPAVDAAESLPSGIVRGAAETLMLPETISRAGHALVGSVMDKVDPLIRTIFGLPPATPLPADSQAPSWATDPLGPAQDATRAAMDATLHKPQTFPGRVAETAGEFLGPGGAPSDATRAAAGLGKLGSYALDLTRNAVVPAVASETAGQVTQGTPLEIPARILGAGLGNTGVALASKLGSPDHVVALAARGLTPAQIDAANALQTKALNMGVPLTGPEAIQQVTNDATKLADVQRFVEGSPQSAQLSAMMAQRPQQMQAAVDQGLDTIAPVSAQPSTLGPRAADAAQGALDDVRQGINTASRPAYAAAENYVMPQADFAPIARDPAFQASLGRLRGDPVLSAVFRNMPDNSGAVIDAVTKDMSDRSAALGNAANPGFQSQSAGLYGAGAASARDILRDPARGGTQAYDDALTMQEQARRQNLAPLEQGPLGQIAGSAKGRGNLTSTQAAADAILPATPLTGGENELIDTIMRLSARDPDLTSQLVRQRLADQADTSMTRLTGGQAQGGGARFAKDIAGSRQAETNLGAVLGALPNSPQAPQRFDDLLDVLRATGTRKPQGSSTDFNAQYRAEMSPLRSLPAAAVTGAAALTSGWGWPALISQGVDTVRRAALGRNNARLADLFTAPDSASQIGDLLARGSRPALTQALGRTAAQTPAVVHRTH